MSYSAKCPTCGYEHDARTKHEADALWESWRGRAPDADRAALQAEVERLRELEAKVGRMVTWLEANQPDVFARGLWDALTPPPQEKGEPK